MMGILSSSFVVDGQDVTLDESPENGRQPRGSNYDGHAATDSTHGGYEEDPYANHGYYGKNDVHYYGDSNGEYEDKYYGGKKGKGRYSYGKKGSSLDDDDDDDDDDDSVAFPSSEPSAAPVTVTADLVIAYDIRGGEEGCRLPSNQAERAEIVNITSQFYNSFVRTVDNAAGGAIGQVEFVESTEICSSTATYEFEVAFSPDTFNIPTATELFFLILNYFRENEESYADLIISPGTDFMLESRFRETKGITFPQAEVSTAFRLQYTLESPPDIPIIESDIDFGLIPITTEFLSQDKFFQTFDVEIVILRPSDDDIDFEFDVEIDIALNNVVVPYIISLTGLPGTANVPTRDELNALISTYFCCEDADDYVTYINQRLPPDNVFETTQAVGVFEFVVIFIEIVYQLAPTMDDITLVSDDIDGLLFATEQFLDPFLSRIAIFEAVIFLPNVKEVDQAASRLVLVWDIFLLGTDLPAAEEWADYFNDNDYLSVVKGLPEENVFSTTVSVKATPTTDPFSP
jgi:hypothetical protein